jgi:hypothetical protein
MKMNVEGFKFKVTPHTLFFIFFLFKGSIGSVHPFTSEIQRCRGEGSKN